MKESSCGRIISQRKQEPILLKHYNTNTSINYSRINQLKSKYLKSNSKTPVTHLLPADQNTKVSDFNNQIKSKIILLQQENIKYEEIKYSRINDIHQFRRRVELTNNSINNKLSNIEEQLNQLKNRELRMLKQARFNKQNKLQAQIRLPQSIKVSKIQPQQSQKQIQIQSTNNQIYQKINTHLSKQNYIIQQSTCRLLGQFKKTTNITNQFITFINRIKDQITLDIDFTQILLSMTAKDLQRVREYLRKMYPNIDLQFFAISSIELDPLQPQNRVKIEGDMEKIARKLYQFYKKIQDHYKFKLYKNYELETINTLFQEIGQNNITIGHLISYINMRTGQQFRNRGLVKILKRLVISSHQIDRNIFMQGFVKK